MTKQILWIDDMPLRAMMLLPIKDSIQITFAHGEDQIAHYLSHTNNTYKWDLIICDHDMPLMDGTEVAKKFLYERSEPIVLCSNNPYAAQRMKDYLDGYSCDTCAVCVSDVYFLSTVKSKLFGG